jgi:hypothetical protein
VVPSVVGMTICREGSVPSSIRHVCPLSWGPLEVTTNTVPVRGTDNMIWAQAKLLKASHELRTHFAHASTISNNFKEK